MSAKISVLLILNKVYPPMGLGTMLSNIETTEKKISNINNNTCKKYQVPTLISGNSSVECLPLQTKDFIDTIGHIYHTFT
jgi:hypothetical protein